MTEDPAEASGEEPLDFAFLAAQTFDDVELQRDVLTLFVAQARRVIPTLPSLGPREQQEAAHLLKGSARGVGAWLAAACADAYEQADQKTRAARFVELAAAFAAVEATIAAHPVFAQGSGA